jgi:hypothetical protein
MVIFATGRIAWADGISLGEYIVYYEKSQMSVISCSNFGETMYLSTTFDSDTAFNKQVWIVPIFSESPPSVDIADEQIFQDLSGFLTGKNTSFDFGMGSLDASAESVEVFQQNEIGVYDLAVIKAESTDDLVSWLSSNGYTVPDHIKSLLEKYISSGMYFVANKIDLKNQYGNVIETIETIEPGFEAMVIYDMEEYVWNLLNTITGEVEADISDYKTSTARYFLSEDDFAFLRNSYTAHRLNDYSSFSADFKNKLAELSGLEDTLGDISYTGFSTPIKITFNPQTCFFPLYISSGSPDNRMYIVVAVIGGDEVYDASGILKSELVYSNNADPIKLSFQFDPATNPLATYFDKNEMLDANNLTVFLNYTTPSELTDDAFFLPVGGIPDTVSFRFSKGFSPVGNPFSSDLCSSNLSAFSGDKAFWVYDPDSTQKWIHKDCLAPCEAGLVHSTNTHLDTLNFNFDNSGYTYADADTCRSTFAGKTGWRLVAIPSLLNQDQIAVGPFESQYSSGGYQKIQFEIPGKGYWVFLQ